MPKAKDDVIAAGRPISETKRTYTFPSGNNVEIVGATSITATDDAHVLQAADGKVHTIRKTWESLVIEPKAVTP